MSTNNLTLHTYGGNPRVFKILIAAQYNDVEISIPETFEMGKDNKTAAFLAKNPTGKVPVLEVASTGAESTCIFESNAIARYIARIRRDTTLYGETFLESGQIDAWVDLCSHEMESPIGIWAFPVLGVHAFNAEATAKAKLDVKKSLQMLENHLLLRTYLVGEHISLADIAVVSAFVYPMKFLMDAAFRKPYPCFNRWFQTCVNQPEFQAVIGDMPLCEKMLQAADDKSVPVTTSKKGASKKKESKKETVAPVVEAKPKKVEHPLATLNKEKPSKMVMDDWKVCYSNTKPLVKSMDWFWENLDTEGYSLWFSNYNYNSENTRMFMTCNAVRGFLQRSEGVRKYAFGVMAVLGEEGEGKGPIEITGCWLFRGDSAEHMIEANPDAEYYTWTKIDTLDAAAKQKVQEYWCNEETLNGKVISDSRVFK